MLFIWLLPLGSTTYEALRYLEIFFLSLFMDFKKLNLFFVGLFFVISTKEALEGNFFNEGSLLVLDC